MTTVDEIEKAVRALAPDQLAEFRSWFERFDSDKFDDKIARDAGAGRLDRLAEQALAERRSGRAREL